MSILGDCSCLQFYFGQNKARVAYSRSQWLNSSNICTIKYKIRTKLQYQSKNGCFFEEQTLNVCTPPNIFYRAPLGFLVNFVAMSPYLHARRLCCRELPVFSMTIPSHCTTPTLLFLFAMLLSGAAHLLRVHDKIFRPVLQSVSRRAQRTNSFTSYNSEFALLCFCFWKRLPR